MLADNDFVHVYAFDFSKAFDTVRHATLMTKFAQMEIPDHVYNWIKAYFDNHAHCTKYAGLVSAVANIQASVIQGSALGPASYTVTAADLHPVCAGNRIFKYADDTYLVVPGNNARTCPEEIEHLQTWATANNLRLNGDKTKEILFSACRNRASSSPPPPCLGIQRVTSLRVLGVILNDKVTAADHLQGHISETVQDRR